MNKESLGRRNYDMEITKLEFQVNDLKEEIKELKVDIKELVEAWNNAKGFTSFIKWAGSIFVAVATILAAVKGWKL